jgi:Tat protein secretion system quality control protein TatD with DNase activity
VQLNAFADQVRWAVSLEKPIIVHSRKAEKETHRILKENMPSVRPFLPLTPPCPSLTYIHTGLESTPPQFWRVCRTRGVDAERISQLVHWVNWNGHIPQFSRTEERCEECDSARKK